MRSAREINADPTLPAKLREEMGLLPDLPKELVDEITPYFETAVKQEQEAKYNAYKRIDELSKKLQQVS